MKTALVTGASAGIGTELAKLFAKDGHNVFLIARRLDRLNDLVGELKAINPKINTWVMSCDLSLPDSPKKVFEFAKASAITVDFLVNNAGFGSNGVFAELDGPKELEMIDLNVRALTALTHLFLPAMLDRKFGRILNVGSMAGFQPGPYMTTYYATKAYVNSFSEALHQELKNTGVSCTVLAPGPVHTEFGAVAKISEKKLFNYVSPANSTDVARAGYKAMMNGCALSIPGFSNKLLLQTQRIAPRSLASRIAGYLNKS
jgi:short-subunit dehydrogenase